MKTPDWENWKKKQQQLNAFGGGVPQTQSPTPSEAVTWLQLQQEKARWHNKGESPEDLTIIMIGRIMIGLGLVVVGLVIAITVFWLHSD